MFTPALGGQRPQARRRRPRAAVAGLAAGALALALAACGEDSSNSEDKAAAAGPYEVEVVTADFPRRQRLGQTTRLRLGVRNEGERAIPALTTTFTIGGEEGVDSRLPFGLRDRQPDLAQPDRPVWVLSEKYPRLVGSSDPAGAQTSNAKTFEFGRLEPDEAVEAVWQLNAVRAGTFELLYEIGSGVDGGSTAETPSGGDAGGSFAVRITDVPPETVVTDSGRVVEAPENPTDANR